MLKIQYRIREWQSRPIWQKTALGLLLICIVFFAVRSFLGKSEKPVLPPNKRVEVTEVKKQHFQQTIRLLGIIHPKHTTVLVAKQSGILDALIPTGQKISKGTLIAKIQNPDLEKSLQLSLSTEALAKAQYERLSQLLKTGYVSPKEAEEKKQVWLEAQKELSKTKIEVDNLRFYAPFDGIIGAYKKREGAQINQNEPVVSIYDPDTLVVDFDIPCSNINSLKEAQNVKVFGQQYKLTHLQKMLDEESHMCPADVEIRCEGCLIGSTVDVDLVLAEKTEAIVIPFQALFLRNSKPFVYIVEKGRVAMLAVETGMRQEEQVEIIKGLKPGQQLILKGQERLYPELAVDIEKPSANSATS